MNIEKLGRLVKAKRAGRPKRETTQEIVESFGAIRLSTLSGVEQWNCPNTETFLKLSDWLQISPAELLHVEDEQFYREATSTARLARLLTTVWRLQDVKMGRHSGDCGLDMCGQVGTSDFVALCPVVRNGGDWHFHLSESKTLGNQHTLVSLVWSPLTGFTIRSCNDKERAEEWAHTHRLIDGEENSYYGIFRRGVWLCGCPVEVVAHEKMEWLLYGRKLGLKRNYLDNLK